MDLTNSQALNILCHLGDEEYYLKEFLENKSEDIHIGLKICNDLLYALSKVQKLEVTCKNGVFSVKLQLSKNLKYL